MAGVSMRQMLEAGVHFGHQTRFWNPKMAPFIFGERNKIHIINLEKTQPMYAEAAHFIKGVIADGGTVLFVGTKRSARESIQKEAERCEQPFVNQRWLGGMLTNFKTIRQSIKRLAELTELAASGALEKRGKKEAHAAAARDGQARKEPGRHQAHGRRCPTRCSWSTSATRTSRSTRRRSSASRWWRSSTPTARPDGIDYVIPGNDDAMRAIQLYAAGIADAVLEGKESVPQVAVGEDEFVELDEAGNPRKKRGARRAAPAARGAQESPGRGASCPRGQAPGGRSRGGRGARTRSWRPTRPSSRWRPPARCRRRRPCVARAALRAAQGPRAA